MSALLMSLMQSWMRLWDELKSTVHLRARIIDRRAHSLSHSFMRLRFIYDAKLNKPGVVV